MAALKKASPADNNTHTHTHNLNYLRIPPRKTLRECPVANGNATADEVEVESCEHVGDGGDGDEAVGHTGPHEGSRLAGVVAADQPTRLHGQPVDTLGRSRRRRFKTIVHGFRPKSEWNDFGKQGYHRKGHLKRSTMVQISAS